MHVRTCAKFFRGTKFKAGGIVKFTCYKLEGHNEYFLEL